MADESDQLEPGQDHGELSPKERFQKTTNIGLLMAYDMIDKLRFWEKETIKLSDEEIAERLEHLINSVEQLRVAYLDFADLDGD
jgi:hypothetical protein